MEWFLVKSDSFILELIWNSGYEIIAKKLREKSTIWGHLHYQILTQTKAPVIQTVWYRYSLQWNRIENTQELSK